MPVAVPPPRPLPLSPEFLRSALESAPDAIIIVDAEGTILFANRQVEALFGYAPAEAVGLSVETLLPERFRARHVIERQRFAAERRARPMGAGLQLSARRSDGTEFPVEISLSPMRDGDRTLVAAAIRDVTDRRRMEAELVAAREAADRANLAKSRFLAMASHDLRQPLQTLSLLNGTLRRMPMAPELAEILAQQEQAIGAMSRLLNALLDISKLESGAVEPEPVDFPVAALLEELRTEFASVAASKGLALHVEACAERIHSDRSLIGQILRNLLSNAIKYTSRGDVRLRCVREQEAVRIEVADTGIGIPADQLPYIYDEFYRIGVTSSGNPEGYGLGLSIVKRLVQLLGVRLEVQSEIGKGSRFSLLVPPAAAGGDEGTAAAPPPPAAEQTGRRSPHVLVVEDDAAVLGATQMLLKVSGFRVTTAASPPEALERAREHADIELIITDYHLSGDHTGIQVIAAVRDVLGKPLNAVLITGDTSLATAEIGRDERVRVASKPINADELLALLHSLVAP